MNEGDVEQSGEGRGTEEGTELQTGTEIMLLPVAKGVSTMRRSVRG